ncbi:MAG TPA: TetR/AcrR family transcriptional regulator [Pseudonocardiaceae bacterium]|jgi:AcrR family transcriptional regulator|nr:TetR/AcrR family transcriptional regulator [Pseudonocardiaceae bacterium]
MSSSGSGRPRRADARRNYELLVLAAREVFAEQGAGAPLEDVARRAGVGNATLYRHFAARHELIIAVYADEVTALCARAGARTGELTPEEALFGWLHAFVEHLAGKRDLALVLVGGHGGPLFDRWHQAMLGTTAALLGRAQRAGTVRADIDAADVLLLAGGIALAGEDPRRHDRMLDVLRHGTARR